MHGTINVITMKNKNIWIFIVFCFSVFALVTFRHLLVDIQVFRPLCPQIVSKSLLASSSSNVTDEDGVARAASYRKPIVISIQNSHFLGDYGYNSITDQKKGPCHLDGIRLDCRSECMWYFRTQYCIYMSGTSPVTGNSNVFMCHIA